MKSSKSKRTQGGGKGKGMRGKRGKEKGGEDQEEVGELEERTQ